MPLGGGFTRRINSASPLVPRAARLARVLPEIEAAYRLWGLPPRVRVLSLLDPAVDAVLDAQGYVVEGETATLHAPIAGPAKPDPHQVEFSGLSPDWLQAKHALSGFTPGQARTYDEVVRRISIPTVYAAVRHDGEIAAVAYGAVHDRMLCVEGVVTAERLRGQGIGRRMVQALIAWGAARSADHACLQVERANTAALALYRGLGFRRELYGYRYRRKGG